MNVHERDRQKQGLPKSVDVFKLCQQTRVFEASLGFKSLPRLVATLADRSDMDESGINLNLSLVLSFSQDDEGHRIVNGKLKIELPVICQRCLKSMLHPISTEFNCAFVSTDEQAKALPAHLEPVMLQADSNYVDLHELLEDELLLNLPIAAYHQQCDGDGSTKSFGTVDVGNTDEGDKPFAALAGLMNKEH